MNDSSQNSLKYYLSPKNSNKKTLVLDLDETLVHSQFVPFSIKSDIVFKIELDNQIHDIHVMVRPGVNEFLKRMGKLYEIVIFTASISKYADPLINIIDKSHICSYRLFREHCSMVGITYIKDLKKLGRDLKDIVIVDNSPISYSFNSENGIPILTWFDDKKDKELYNLIPILEFLSSVYDVREYIKKIVVNDSISYDKSLNIIENCTKQKHNNPNKKNIRKVISNKKSFKYIDNKNGKENDKNKANCQSNESAKIIINNKAGKKDNKNYTNITISNNAINNYIYFSPIYNINNTNTIIYQNFNTYNDDIEIKINPKIFQSKENTISYTRTNRTRSKESISNNNSKRKNKIKNKSNDFKKINPINNNNIIKKNYKEKINKFGNKSINYCINMSCNLNSLEPKKGNICNINSNIKDLKTLIPPKKTKILKDYKLPKTAEIEEILYPFNEKIIDNINNKKTVNIIKRNVYQNKRGNSSIKQKNGYILRNSLYKFNNEVRSRSHSVTNHEKHKSFNSHSFTSENNFINSLKKSKNLNNYFFYEPISNQTYKNNYYSNNKMIRSTERSKTSIKTTNDSSLNSINKIYLTINESINRGKNTNHKSKLSINNSKKHKKTLSNPYKIIDVIEYNKSKKIERSMNYNLTAQNGNAIRNNYQKIHPQNRNINTENSFNRSLNKNKGLYTTNNRKVNSGINRNNVLVSQKKLFNNTFVKNNMKKSITSNNNISNYDPFISHKKTLSYNGEMKLYRTNTSSTLSRHNQHQNIKDNKYNHKEVYINHTNMNKDNKYKKFSRNIKGDANENINNKIIDNKISKVKKIKYNKNKIDINENNIINLNKK